MWFKQNLRPFQCLFAGQFTSCQQAPRSQDIGFSVFTNGKTGRKRLYIVQQCQVGGSGELGRNSVLSTQLCSQSCTLYALFSGVQILWNPQVFSLCLRYKVFLLHTTVLNPNFIWTPSQRRNMKQVHRPSLACRKSPRPYRIAMPILLYKQILHGNFLLLTIDVQVLRDRTTAAELCVNTIAYLYIPPSVEIRL